MRAIKLILDNIVGGGQAIGMLEGGKKAFVWGGLPDEAVEFRITKKKSKFVEGVITKIITASPNRIEPVDLDSYLSTSPWQIMSFAAEQRYKSQLIREAFLLHSVDLQGEISLHTDHQLYHYRNKVEFSWYGSSLAPNKESEQEYEHLDLAFFRRGGKGKIPVKETSLARDEINTLARAIRDLLHTKGVTARQLKTLLIRCDQQGNCVWQLYTKEKLPDVITIEEAEMLPAQGGEVIYSDPRSPASRITERLAAFGNIVLTDTILDIPFRYATEGFFQVNLPVYERALRDMAHFVVAPAASLDPTTNVVDLYAGVGTIGLTIGGNRCTLVEIDEHAVREMKRNITDQKNQSQAILAPSEKALDYITPDTIVILDPPRAGLHPDVIKRLLSTQPPRIIYLSCNPVTQARDVELLLEKYQIIHHQGYNFFPRTPHIEHLVILNAL